MILIKDNHLAMMEGGSIALAVQKARKASDAPIMVEVDTIDQLEEALFVEPDMILLDNMSPKLLHVCVEKTIDICKNENLHRPQLEASGKVNLTTVRAIAESGVDRISVGALTHSAKAVDIGLDFVL